MNIIIWFIFCRHIKFSLSSKQYYDINYDIIMQLFVSDISDLFRDQRFCASVLDCEFQY